MPTRLLKIGPSGNSNEICLEIKGKTEPVEYIALSYCWGRESKNESPAWATLRGNLEERCHGFQLSSLPGTLKDAVEVSRQLGIQYLWIDSLCIIQDSDEDWETESKRMESVFALAYCTIAATAAEHCESGFLNRTELTDGIDVQNITGEDNATSIQSIDFDRDTSQAPLNRRAWVMQERYLSPRTIHFCTNRVYGECGEGVYAGKNVWLKT